MFCCFFERLCTMNTAIVTGASGDIGKEICKKFLSEGYRVVACYLNNEASAKELENAYGKDRVLAIKADISKAEDVDSIYKNAQDTFGSIDVVVNNAAVALKGLIQDTTPKELDDICNINIKGTYLMCSIGVKYMVANHRGSIVNISSMWGEVGASCEVAYSMTKSAVIGLTKALAKEVGPCGIRVNCVSPGLIDTRMNSCYTKEDLDAICDETPLMRIGTPCDVADAVWYLSSDASSFVTGQVLGVNGGFVI